MLEYTLKIQNYRYFSSIKKSFHTLAKMKIIMVNVLISLFFRNLHIFESLKAIKQKVTDFQETSYSRRGGIALSCITVNFKV